MSAIPEAVLSVNLCNELEQSILEENVKCCECIQNDWLSIRIGADEIKIHSLIAKKSSDCPKPALIWIHGFGGTGAISFGLSGILDRLINQYDVYTIDVPGFGRSTLPKGISTSGHHFIKYG